MKNNELNLLATSLERSREKAMTSGDSALLHELLSEELYYGHSGGYADTKESFLRKFDAGQYAYAAVNTKINQVSEIGEEGLVISGEVEITVTLYGEQKIMRSIYLAVWRSEEGTWRFLSHQTALIS